MFTYIPSCRRDESKTSFPLQEGIFVYTLVNCTIKLTFAFVTHANNNNDNKLRKLLYVLTFDNYVPDWKHRGI